MIYRNRIYKLAFDKYQAIFLISDRQVEIYCREGRIQIFLELLNYDTGRYFDYLVF